MVWSGCDCHWTQAGQDLINVIREEQTKCQGQSDKNGIELCCGIKEMQENFMNKKHFIYLHVILDFSYGLFFFKNLLSHCWHSFCPCALYLFPSQLFNLPPWVCLLKIDEQLVWSYKGAKIMQRLCRKSMPWTVSRSRCRWPRCGSDSITFVVILSKSVVPYLNFTICKARKK